MQMNRIVIDAMGGDNAPTEIVKGALEACKLDSKIKCVLVGDETKIHPLVKDSTIPSNQLEIVHASEFIKMDDHPKEAVNEKEDASINVATRLLRDGKGAALVSAGNTGAVILSCSKNVPRMPGIERGVLAAIFPANKNKASDPGVAIMLDVGATLHCTVTQLVSFAIMGIHYAKEVMSISKPRVGLLNIGEEDSKGHETLVDTNKTLRSNPHVNFIGNIEGKDIMRGTSDVIITEGITGNIVLKGLEGMAEMAVQAGKQIWKKSLLSKMGFIMLAPVLKKIKKRFDYSEYGGAPILGFQKLIIKSHGRSNVKAIKNAILLAQKSTQGNLIKHMKESMKEFYLEMFEQNGNSDDNSTENNNE